MYEDESQKIFASKSRSFSLAARLFAGDIRGGIARLYRFCRYIDDLADSSNRGEPERLGEIADCFRSGQSQSNDPIVQDFLELAATFDLPLEAAVELAEALREDCGPRSLNSKADLIRFAYGVAGTVGLLLRPILGGTDERAGPFAIELGIALQLTNIARDVAEDAARDRFYLPSEWVGPSTLRKALETLPPETNDAVRTVDEAVACLLHLASDYYASARRGLWFIPPRNRHAVYFAAAFYQAIGDKLLRQGSGGWRKRVHLGTLEKLIVAGAALPGYMRLRRSEWSRAEPPEHAAHLHTPLGPSDR
jgi:15-cis-phytoene synthase